LPEELKIAVFASGAGSNFHAILEAIRGGKIPNASIAVVISNNSDAGALALAKTNGIPAVHMSQKQFASADEFTIGLLAVLREAKANFIVLAGYMKKIDPRVVQTFRNRIVNIHPALLPAFGGPGMYGKFVHEAVIVSGAALSGATVHLVDEEYDRGPIVLQRFVPVEPADTPETLAAKVLKVEHELYPEVIRLFALGKVVVDGQHVTIMNS
jgi:formyltetrahydrofolate-dependent phosphoribosylglycinamide formyltransferase